MRIAIEPLTPDAEADWDALIARSANGTIQHTRRFLSYHPPERWDDRSLVLRDKRRIVGVFPAARTRRNGRSILLSHPGASYGGLVTEVTARSSMIASMLEAIDDHAVAEGFHQIEMRHSPIALRRSEHGQLDFAMLRHGYERVAEELSTFYHLPDIPYVEDFDSFVGSFPSGARRGIRKGARTLTTHILDLKDLERFHEILSDTLDARYGKAPVHTVEEMEALLGLFPDDVFILGVYLDEVLVGGYFVLAQTKTALHIFYAALDYRFQEHRPLDFALARLIHLGHQQGRTVVNYGISTEDGGRVLNEGLLRFKEGFGGRGSIRSTWAKVL